MMGYFCSVLFVVDNQLLVVEEQGSSDVYFFYLVANFSAMAHALLRILKKNSCLLIFFWD